MCIFQFSYHPVIQWSVVFKLQGTDRVGNTFNGIFNRMSEVIHWVNTPLISCVVVGHMCHAVNNRVSHINVRRCHINFSAKYLTSVFKLSVFHFFKQFQVFFHTSVSVWAFFSRLCQSSSIFSDFLCCQVADKGFSFLNQLYCCFIHLLKIIGRKIEAVLPVCAKPFNICFNRFHKLYLFFCRIGIVKTHVKLSMIFLCQPII